MTERLQLVSPRYQKLSVRKQCELLEVHRSRLYYKPVEEKPENLKIMRIMDEHLLKRPSEGVISMVNLLGQKGYHVNHKRVRRLLRKMGKMAIYPRKMLSILGQKIYIRPYLLRGLIIDRPNQVWAIDITYIPMAKGFMYCTAIIDLYSRMIVGWGISNTLEAKWCLNVLETAIEQYGTPEIINSDQGSQFTSSLWVHTLEEKKIRISMDGKGRAIDNRFIERFWRTLKTNHIYLHPAENGLELYEGINEYISYYNTEKVHQTINEIPQKKYLEKNKYVA